MPRDRLLSSAGLFALLLAPPLFAQTEVEKPKVPPTSAPPVKEPSKEEVKRAEADRKALEEAGLKADDADGLIKYVRSRTLPAVEVGKITAIVQKMNGEAAFDDRLAAQEELLKLGGQAVDVLRKQAKESRDAEVVYRTQTILRKLEKDKQFGTEVMPAVLRALGKVRSEAAAETLLGFLPLADGGQTVDLIQEAVTANAGTDGKPTKAVVDALADENPLRRQVAAVALVAGGTPAQRVRFKDVYPKVVELLKADKDHGLRFVLAKTLLVDCREKEAVGVLIDLMPGMTRGQSWQAEELLTQIAGPNAPKERCKHVRDQSNPTRETAESKTARTKARDAWKKWWEGAAAKTDVAAVDVRVTVRGELVVVTSNNNRWPPPVTVTEYAPDGSEKNRMEYTNPNGGNLCDAVARDDGKLLTLEHNVNQIQVRDWSGRVTTTWNIPDKNARVAGFQARGLTLLDDNRVLAVHANGFTEFDAAGKVVLTYTRPEAAKNQPKSDLCGAVRLKGGVTLISVMNAAQNSGELVFLDDKGKEIADRKPIKTGMPNQRNTLTALGDDRLLLCEQSSGRALEYNLKTGKAEGMKVDNAGYVQFLQRLPNGNVLYPDNSTYPQRLVERAQDGTEVWSLPPADRNGNIQYIRAYVR